MADKKVLVRWKLDSALQIGPHGAVHARKRGEEDLLPERQAKGLSVCGMVEILDNIPRRPRARKLPPPQPRSLPDTTPVRDTELGSMVSVGAMLRDAHGRMVPVPLPSKKRKAKKKKSKRRKASGDNH